MIVTKIETKTLTKARLANRPNTRGAEVLASRPPSCFSLNRRIRHAKR